MKDKKCDCPVTKPRCDTECHRGHGNSGCNTPNPCNEPVNTGCGCGNVARPFVSFQGGTCGCEEPKSSGCDCCQ